MKEASIVMDVLHHGRLLSVPHDCYKVLTAMPSHMFQSILWMQECLGTRKPQLRTLRLPLWRGYWANSNFKIKPHAAQKIAGLSLKERAIIHILLLRLSRRIGHAGPLKLA